MAYKGILVHVEATQAAQARVNCAADLADQFGALLIGCGSEMVPQIAEGPFAARDGQMLSLMLGRVDEQLAQSKAAFERLAGERPRKWISERLMPDEALTLAARSADLIVTSRAAKGDEDSLRNEDPGLLVVISGRPVLVVPPGRDYLPLGRVLVCWKDSRESRRALTDALPILQRANDVLVAEVAAPADLVAACQRSGDVAEALHRHGVSAHSEGLIKDERRVADILQTRASDFGADLIVAGGYGRSRLGEWAFGGVTRALLTQTDRFVLLSH